MVYRWGHAIRMWHCSFRSRSRATQNHMLRLANGEKYNDRSLPVTVRLLPHVSSATVSVRRMKVTEFRVSAIVEVSRLRRCRTAAMVFLHGKYWIIKFLKGGLWFIKSLQHFKYIWIVYEKLYCKLSKYKDLNPTI